MKAVRKAGHMTHRKDAFIRLGLLLMVLLLLNVLSSFFHFRLDLTSEKRYSISQPSINMMKNLKDEVTVKVYLDGELNAGFTRLKESTRNLLDEFRVYGGKNIQYEFIDPMAVTNLDERKLLIQDLIEKGLAPTNLTTRSKTESKQQLIFPGAIVTYGGREMPVQLLENQIGFSPQQILNNSEILLEYKFANAVRKLLQFRPPGIAFISGHDELSELETADIRQTLTSLHYEVKDLDLTQTYYIPERFELAVIAKPHAAFDEKDKYKIDQFIMHGGKVLWLLDGTNATMDSLKVNPTGQFISGNDFNLDDMLFKYGVRINTDVVQDINLCNQIPLVVGQMGNAPQTEMFPWYYFPLLISDNHHPIVRNLDPVASYFASTIDTVKNPGVSKTILLRTTDNAKAQLAPTRVHFGILQGKPNPEYYNQPRLPVAVLMEGEFESAYKNRLSPEFLAASDTIQNLKFLDKSKKSRMIVISDGDIIRSEIRNDSSAYPLGYYMFTKQQFANKDFILNCVEYLVDETGILQTRNKEVKLRLLNTVKVQQERMLWQVINLVIPIVLVILFGIGFNFYRKKRYAGQ